MKRKYITPNSTALELMGLQMMAMSIGKSETEVDAADSYSNHRQLSNPIWGNNDQD